MFEWTGRSPNLTTGNPALIARLHVGPEGGAVYVLNPTRSEQKATIALGDAHKSLKIDGAYWGSAGSAKVVIPPRDIVILKLRS